MFRMMMLTLVLAAVVGIGSEPGLAQEQPDDPTCPVVIDSVLTAIEQNCTDVSRNSACYGNNRVEVQFVSEQPPGTFDAPADQAALALLREIRTSPLDLARELWGVAVMNVQANVPDTLPGQAVTFILMGETTVENQAELDGAQPAADPIAVEITANTALNMRSGPTISSNVLGSLPPGTRLLADGVDPSGEWVRVSYGGGPAWTSRAFVQPVDPTDNLGTLPQLTGTSASPMQAFYFTTGIGRSQCRQAPDALIIQGPEQVRVDLNINGAAVGLGSTIVLQTLGAPEGALSGGSSTTDGVLLQAPFYVFPVDTDTVVIAEATGDTAAFPLADDVFVRPVDSSSVLLTTAFDGLTGINNNGGIFIDPSAPGGPVLQLNVALPQDLAGVTIDGVVRLRSADGGVAVAVDPLVDPRPKAYLLQGGSSRTVALNEAQAELAGTPFYEAALANRLIGSLDPVAPTATPQPQTGVCFTTEMIVLDGEANLNSGGLNVPLGHAASLESCVGADGELTGPGGGPLEWNEEGIVDQERLNEFALLEDLPEGVLRYRVRIPTEADIERALNPPTPVPRPPGDDDDRPDTGGGNLGVDCSGFRGTSPTDGMAFGLQTFFWDAAPGASFYRVVVNATDRPGTVVGDIDAPVTTLTLDLGVGALNQMGRSMSTVWRVQAFAQNAAGEMVVACETAPIAQAREFISDMDLCRLLDGYYSEGTCFDPQGSIIDLPN
ncbi:MAG: SH3 domain-containing protein [Chloroflexota bacterium]